MQAGVAVSTAADFLLAWVVFFLLALAVAYFGIMLAALTPNGKIASIFLPLAVNVWNMTSGYLVY